MTTRMTFDELFDTLIFDEKEDKKTGHIIFEGRFLARCKKGCRTSIYRESPDEIRDFFRHSIAKSIYDSLKEEFDESYSEEDLRCAYEMGARDGMFSGQDRFERVVDLIMEMKGWKRRVQEKNAGGGLE